MKAIFESDPSICDNLMKYVFRGLGEAKNCGAMLKWHGALTKTAGMGPIVRSMTDRKTI